MTISDEAVEAAAKEIHSHHWGDDMANRPEATKELYRDRARAALEAAAPLIRAQALEDAADGLPFLDRPKNMLVRQQDAAAWLRARAADERDTKNA